MFIVYILRLKYLNKTQYHVHLLLLHEAKNSNMFYV